MAVVCYVVGDEFGSFARNPGVITVAELDRALATQSRSGSIDFERTQLTPAIGLADHTLDRLRVALSAAGAPDETVARFTRTRASLELTHKHDPEHVMIGALQPIASGVYLCPLLLDAQCDRLSDHVTGQHLGGMPLVEAARQAAIAVVEVEYGEQGKQRWGLAWTGMRVSFHGYAFPLPAHLHIVCTEDLSKRRTRQRTLAATVAVHQAGRLVCEVAFECTLFDAIVLQKMEAKAAKRALSRAQPDSEAVVPSLPLTA